MCTCAQVHARVSELAAQRLAEACANCTFHPNLSQKSLRIARRMDIDFLARQQQHLSRRQKKVCVCGFLNQNVTVSKATFTDVCRAIVDLTPYLFFSILTLSTLLVILTHSRYVSLCICCFGRLHYIYTMFIQFVTSSLILSSSV